MDCTTTSSARTARNQARWGGFTLAELMVATGVGGIVLAAVMSVSLFAGRSLCGMGNYTVLDMKSRHTLDVMTRDIRQANACSTNAFSPTALTLLMADPDSGQAYTVNYTYNAARGTLTRTDTDPNDLSSTMLLTNCSFFAFSYFQRDPTNGAWAVFPVDTNRPDECKLVQIDWTCAKTLLGSETNSESMVSARVVIRKE